MMTKNDVDEIRFSIAFDLLLSEYVKNCAKNSSTVDDVNWEKVARLMRGKIKKSGFDRNVCEERYKYLKMSVANHTTDKIGADTIIEHIRKQMITVLERVKSELENMQNVLEIDLEQNDEKFMSVSSELEDQFFSEIVINTNPEIIEDDSDCIQIDDDDEKQKESILITSEEPTIINSTSTPETVEDVEIETVQTVENGEPIENGEKGEIEMIIVPDEQPVQEDQEEVVTNKTAEAKDDTIAIEEDDKAEIEIIEQKPEEETPNIESMEVDDDAAIEVIDVPSQKTEDVSPEQTKEPEKDAKPDRKRKRSEPVDVPSPVTPQPKRMRVFEQTKPEPGETVEPKTPDSGDIDEASLKLIKQLGSGKERLTRSRTKKVKAPDQESEQPDNEQQDELAKQTKIKELLLNVVSTLVASNSKAAEPFQQPVTEQIAPGYSMIIKQKKDLSSIKKRIREKKITSVTQLWRDLVLLFQNAQLFNPPPYAIHEQAKELRSEAREIVHKALLEESQILNRDPPAIYFSKVLFPTAESMSQ